MAFTPARLMELMIEAGQNVAKLPAAMVSFGVALTAAALSLIIFKAPAGILLRLHGSTPEYVYYGGLIATVAFGLVEAFFGYWVVPCDLNGWRAFGKTVLWISILPLLVVAALGGFALLK
ncbi:hypothetical protein BS78_08G117600 [Paspalum vaginatum]|nr:hypothetical protein BS78_08G117600 [Paspalum vaginatum]